MISAKKLPHRSTTVSAVLTGTNDSSVRRFVFSVTDGTPSALLS